MVTHELHLSIFCDLYIVKNQNLFLRTWIKFVVRYNKKSKNDINKLESNATHEQTKKLLTHLSIFGNSCQPK